MGLFGVSVRGRDQPFHRGPGYPHPPGHHPAGVRGRLGGAYPAVAPVHRHRHRQDTALVPLDPPDDKGGGVADAELRRALAAEDDPPGPPGVIPQCFRLQPLPEQVFRPDLAPEEEERFRASCARMEEFWRTIPGV